jgi:hypothetical protein
MADETVAEVFAPVPLSRDDGGVREPEEADGEMVRGASEGLRE